MDKLDEELVNNLIAQALEERDQEQRTVMQANFSALLYLVSEQQALIGRLLQSLLGDGIIRAHNLTKITDIDEGDEGLVPMYTQVYNRFASYFLRTKELLEQGEARVETVKTQGEDIEDE